MTFSDIGYLFGLSFLHHAFRYTFMGIIYASFSGRMSLVIIPIAMVCPWKLTVINYPGMDRIEEIERTWSRRVKRPNCW